MTKIINTPNIGSGTIVNSSSNSIRVNPRLETKPDVIEISSKQKDKKSVLTSLLELVAISLGVLPPIKPNMSLQDVQAHFKDIFLNDSLSLGETKVMIDRYKELECIEDDEEYVKAVYKEAKENYGLRNTMSELQLVDEISQNPDFEINGFTDPLGDVTISTKGRTRSQMFNTIHHELRHVKQMLYAFNYDPDTYVSYSQPQNIEIPKDVFNQAFGCEASIENIPKSSHKFAKKCIDGIKSYKAALKGLNGYSKQFVEKDAYSAGERMAKIMKNV